MMSMAAGLGWKIFPQVRTFLFPETKEVFYIGGADILPTPLNAREEAEAISGIGTEREEEVKKKLAAQGLFDPKKKLIEHNLRLVVYIAKKFDNT